jgi:tetratricopeptide (TPR) repeat protein
MKDILKYSIWVGIYAILIIPFIVANGMFFPFIVGKAFTFRIIVEILLALWLILAIKYKEFRPKFSWIIACAGIFTLILLLADIFAVAPHKAFWSNYERMEGWVTIVHLFAYLLVLGSMLNTEKLWVWFLRANVFAGVVLAITSLDNSTEIRFSGPLGNPIYISVYFLFIFFFAFILWYKDVLTKYIANWSIFKKAFSNVLFYIYPAVMILSFYAVFRTSRGVLLGLIGGLFIAAILIAIFERERKVIRQISFGLIIAVVLIVATFLGSRQTQFVKSNPTLSRLAEVSWSNVNGQARQYIWPMAIKGFKEKPILGWGQDGFNYVFNKYYDPRMYGQEQWFDRAHNAPIDFLIAGGILGLLSYLALFASALYLLWFRKNHLSITERSLLTGLFAGYFFQGLFVFDNLASYIMFFTTLAYIHARLSENKTLHKALDREIGDDYQNYILIPIVVVLTAVGIYWINIPAISANQSLIQALRLAQAGRVEDSENAFKQALSYKSLGDSEIREQLLSFAPEVARAPQIDNQTKLAILNFTYNEINNQIALVPDDARYYILMGSFLNSVGNADKALPYVEKAIELSPKKQTMRFQLIQSLVNLGKIDEAIAEAKAAYELDTNFDQAKGIYNEILGLKKGK